MYINISEFIKRSKYQMYELDLQAVQPQYLFVNVYIGKMGKGS